MEQLLMLIRAHFPPYHIVFNQQLIVLSLVEGTGVVYKKVAGVRGT